MSSWAPGWMLAQSIPPIVTFSPARPGLDRVTLGPQRVDHLGRPEAQRLQRPAVVPPLRLAIAHQAPVAHLGDLDRLLRHAAVRHVELRDDALLGGRARSEQVDAAADVAQVVGGVVDGVAERSTPRRRRSPATRAVRPHRWSSGPSRAPALSCSRCTLAANRASAASIGSGAGSVAAGRRGSVEVVDGERRVEQPAHVGDDVGAVAEVLRGRPDPRRGSGGEHVRCDALDGLLPHRGQRPQGAERVLEVVLGAVEPTGLAGLRRARTSVRRGRRGRAGAGGGARAGRLPPRGRARHGASGGRPPRRATAPRAAGDRRAARPERRRRARP